MLLGWNLNERRLINHNPEPGTLQSPFVVVSNAANPSRSCKEARGKDPRCSGEGKQTGGVNLGGPRRLRTKPAWLCPIKAGCKTLLRFLVVPFSAHLAASGKSTPGAHWLAWRLTFVLTLLHSTDWWAAIDLLQEMLFSHVQRRLYNKQ